MTSIIYKCPGGKGNGFRYGFPEQHEYKLLMSREKVGQVQADANELLIEIFQLSKLAIKQSTFA